MDFFVLSIHDLCLMDEAGIVPETNGSLAELGKLHLILPEPGGHCHDQTKVIWEHLPDGRFLFQFEAPKHATVVHDADRMDMVELGVLSGAVALKSSTRETSFIRFEPSVEGMRVEQLLLVIDWPTSDLPQGLVKMLLFSSTSSSCDEQGRELTEQAPVIPTITELFDGLELEPTLLEVAHQRAHDPDPLAQFAAIGFVLRTRLGAEFDQKHERVAMWAQTFPKDILEAVNELVIQRLDQLATQVEIAVESYWTGLREQDEHFHRQGVLQDELEYVFPYGVDEAEEDYLIRVTRQLSELSGCPPHPPQALVPACTFGHHLQVERERLEDVIQVLERAFPSATDHEKAQFWEEMVHADFRITCALALLPTWEFTQNPRWLPTQHPIRREWWLKR